MYRTRWSRPRLFVKTARRGRPTGRPDKIKFSFVTVSLVKLALIDLTKEDLKLLVKKPSNYSPSHTSSGNYAVRHRLSVVVRTWLSSFEAINVYEFFAVNVLVYPLNFNF